MKRVLLLVIAAAAVASAAWYVMRVAGIGSAVPVAALLPRETIFLIHAPDFNRTRDQWHHLDIYQLYREPAVQEFLRKPLTRLPKREAASETLQDVEQLDPNDAFLAITLIDRNNLRFAAGLRFRGSEQDAERVIGKWRVRLLDKNPNAQRETIDYERHKIESVGVGPVRFASAYDEHWFFVANDLSELKRLLDRVDGRNKDRQSTLEADESYRAAIAHMPSGYAALFYFQPKTLADQIQSLRAAIGSAVSSNEPTPLAKVQSVCGTTRLEDGKIHDVLFVGMPKLEQVRPLTRSSLNLGTKDTILYLATLLDIAEKIDILGQSPGITERLQKIFQTFTDNGITADDWKSAFEPELATLADWPETMHWPSVLFTLPVIDAGKASKIVEAATRIDEDSSWTRTEKDGVRYLSMRSPASLIAITPTIALSDRIVIGGLNAATVEEAMKRSRNSGSELSNGEAYRTAARSIPPPTNFFAYVDTAQLYMRLDATVRPLALMAAAFMPGVNEYVDLDKVPAAEVIAKHLSPIVSSQRYDRDGYVAESVGPVTFNQAVLGLVILGVGVGTGQKAGSGLGALLPRLPTPSPSGTP